MIEVFDERLSGLGRVVKNTLVPIVVYPFDWPLTFFPLIELVPLDGIPTNDLEDLSELGIDQPGLGQARPA